MELKKEASECGKHDPIIVCEEKGKKYTAINPERKFEVRKYHLDGILVVRQLCCDYVVINDSTEKAYYVELKGQDIKHAVAQVLAGERLCCDSLGGYKSHYRIVPKKSRTLDIKSKEYRNLYDKVGPKRLRCETGRLEDILD